MRFGQRAAEDREVLREEIDETAVNPTPPGDHAIAERSVLGHAEVGGAVGDESIQLDERTGVEEEVEAFARSELPLLVLLRDPRGAATLFGQGLAVSQVLESGRVVGHIPQS